MIQRRTNPTSKERSREADDVESFALALAAALKALRFHPSENAARKARDTLIEASNHLLSEREKVELVRHGDLWSSSEPEVPLDLSSAPLLRELLETLGQHGIGGFTVEGGVEAGEWDSFLESLLDDPSSNERPAETLTESLESRGVQHIRVTPMGKWSRDRSGSPPFVEEIAEDRLRAVARSTYRASLQAVHELFDETLNGRVVNIRRATAAVQSIVDVVLEDHVSIMAMTMLKDYDEYTYTHSVNVAVLSTLIGHEIGLTPEELKELGVAALLHDIGKARVDSGEEHPGEGLLPSQSSEPSPPFLDPTMVEYEHHGGTDLSRHPRKGRPRNPGLFSRIVAVADTFDALTSTRGGRKAIRPDEALQTLSQDPSFKLDPLLVRALSQVTGVHPIGTVVVLNTGEVGVVLRPHADPSLLHRPTVKVLRRRDSGALAEPIVVDLAERDARTGVYRRSILDASEPEAFGIHVPEHVP